MTQSTETTRAYFLIADISGYTKFLAETEIDHARGVLQGLFDAIVPAIRAPLTISNLQGDAVFAYAVEQDLASRQFILDVTERLYCVFRQARERIRINTNCPCRACATIGELDLKFVVHNGECARQEVAGRTELVGKDVITAFRLLKNDVTERTGLTAYALLTDEAVRHMELQPYFEPSQHVQANYEHIGETGFVVHDLERAWQKAHDARRIFVGPDDTLLMDEVTIPVKRPPEEAFILCSRADLRARWVNADKIDVIATVGAKVSAGTVYHCHHGKEIVSFEIVDWRPGEYLTARYKLPMGMSMLETDEMTQLGDGTLLRFRFGMIEGGGFVGGLLRGLMRRVVIKSLAANVTTWRERLTAMSEHATDATAAAQPGRSATQ